MAAAGMRVAQESRGAGSFPGQGAARTEGQPLSELMPLIGASLGGVLLSGWVLAAGVAQVSLGVPLLVGIGAAPQPVAPAHPHP